MARFLAVLRVCQESGFGTASDIRRDGTIRPLTHHQKASTVVDVHTDERPLSCRRLSLENDHSADMLQLLLDLGIESGPHRQAHPSTRTLGQLWPRRRELWGPITARSQSLTRLHGHGPARVAICSQKRVF